MKIETERLIFEQITLDFTESLFPIFGDPEVMKFWYGGADQNIEQTNRRVKYLEEHWKVFGFGDWAIVSKTDSKVIGFAGLHYIKDVAEVNIGYAFAKSVWRQGFAFESCKEIIKFGFNKLNLEQIIAVIWPINQASINLAQKCGFEYWKTIMWKGSERVVYSFAEN